MGHTTALLNSQTWLVGVVAIVTAHSEGLACHLLVDAPYSKPNHKLIKKHAVIIVIIGKSVRYKRNKTGTGSALSCILKPPSPWLFS